MAGESLKGYQKEMNANTNKGWPLTYGTDNPKGYQVQQTGFNPLFGTGLNPAQTGWPNNWSSSDPILNFDSTSSSSIDTSGLEVAQQVMLWTGVATAGLGIAGSIASMVQAFRGSKSEKATSQASDSTLANLVETANGYDKKSNKSEMMSTSNTLTNQRNNAQTRLDNAKRNKTTAQSTLSNLSSQKNKFTTELSNFDTAKATLESDITDIEGQIAALDKDDPNYATAKEALEQQKAQKEKQLKSEYSDANRKKITDQINRIEKSEEEWNLRLAEAEQDITQLPGEIQKADKAIKKLNKLIGTN